MSIEQIGQEVTRYGTVYRRGLDGVFRSDEGRILAQNHVDAVLRQRLAASQAASAKKLRAESGAAASIKAGVQHQSHNNHLFSGQLPPRKRKRPELYSR